MRAPGLATLGLAALLAACGVRRPHPGVEEAGPMIARGAGPSEPASDGADERLACVEHPRIDGWERRLRAAQGIETLLARGAEVAPVLRPILVDEGVSPDLSMLPAIESSFRDDARSSAGARGLWQLLPETARELGLVVGRTRDDRLRVDAATRAAGAMLRRLRQRYGDWALALAAYHAGEGTLDRAIARAGGDATFWDLAEAGRLPPTTTEYVPRVLAIVRLADDSCLSGRGLVARGDR